MTEEEFDIIRLKLIEIAGVDILSLREECSLPKKYTWKRDDYTCTKCGATWDDSTLNRHHLIPRRLAKYLLNLTRHQVDNPINTAILCEKCHQKMDEMIRKYIIENFPDIWLESRLEKLSRWWG